MSVDLFGRYQSQTTRQLAQINSSKYPDTNKDMEANLRRVNAFIDYIAQYLQVMQKGVDQANEDGFMRIKDMASDLVVLLGGGELLYGIDLGDLEYFLPALGAIFGFDTDKPFPISLFEMAEHFFLGYVVPLDAFGAEIQDIINGWATALGLDPEFVDALNEVMSAMVDLGTTLLDILNELYDLLEIFGINLDGFGPFADLWHVVTQLLGSFDLTQLGDLADPVLHALAPWVQQLALLLDQFNSVIKAFSGGLTDLTGILNFAGLFTPFTDLMAGVFDPGSAWFDIVSNALLPTGLLTSISEIVGALIPGVPDGGLFDLEDWAQGLLGFTTAQSALPVIGSGQVSTIPQNLFRNPLFQTLASFIPGTNVTWDGTTSHAAVGGSALFTLVGSTVQSLLGNIVDVQEGDQLDFSAWTKWANVTGSGPIALMINAYDELGQLIPAATQVIDSILPGLNNDWTQMLGSYVVPTGMGVASIAARFNVASGLNGGSVWFDDASLIKPNLILPDSVLGPLAGSGTLVADFQDTVNAIAGTANAALDDVENRLNDMLNSVSILNGSNIGAGDIATDFISDLQVNFTNIVTKLLGWDAPAPGTWYAPDSAAGALGTQADAVLGNAGTVAQHSSTLNNHGANISNLLSRVSSLESAGGGSPGGGTTLVQKSDDFERTTFGGGWSVSDSNYTLDGHNAYWNASSFAFREAICQVVGTGNASNTDYQVVYVTIGSYAPTYQGSYYGWNLVHGRMGFSTKATFAVRADGYWEFRIGGTVYQSGTGAVLGIGSTMALYCGIASSSTLNGYTCVVNNSTLWQGTAGSIAGSSNRGWGFGSIMNGTGTPFFGQSGYGGKVNQFYAADVAA